LNMDENNYRVYVNFVSFIFQVFFSLQVWCLCSSKLV
jgi:hypothetical protein